jgi:benzylsuccinate CoA-transferase BbsF subunit
MNKQVLEGVKVLDFGWALVGSLTSKVLADHGATVVRIESIHRIDLGRVNRITKNSDPANPDDKPWFVHLSTSKLSFAINLKHPKSSDTIKKLIMWADVINENFTPGTMEKLGFGYETIKAYKPDIIMNSGSAYGQTGPMAQQWGIDGTGAALSGYLHFTGWPDRGPVGPQPPYGDTIVPQLDAMAIVAALDYRRRTGKGQHIDGAMVDIATHQITPALLDVQINNNLETRNGNRIARASPHGVFPCRGEDKWCAVAVFNQQQWQSFCKVIGNPIWVKNPKFVDLKSRKENETELEKNIAKWTIKYTAEEVMEKMQEAGVPAGVAQSCEDICDKDPQLKARDFLIQMKHPVIGMMGHPTPPIKLSKTNAQIKTAPRLGEHTRMVCTEMLGISAEEFEALAKDRLFE